MVQVLCGHGHELRDDVFGAAGCVEPVEAARRDTEGIDDHVGAGSRRWTRARGKIIHGEPFVCEVFRYRVRGFGMDGGGGGVAPCRMDEGKKR
ncbi:hypothetical protein GCM10010211_20000 [Streptomyces albospinus]|uniref:Uncharacterized protein n=1 Tax=Streptomyces albospinus TaxID=285515 RepID=A0ABQ2UXX3_9ACTN|nr:hypothetical protein GCM10010211_20000 [Streptomyces albospinus]